VINFDETEFCIDCTREKQIIVFEEIKQIYAISSKNRKSVTIVEMINAVEDYSSLLMIIIQKQEIMTN
jgi:hypothetical protein